MKLLADNSIFNDFDKQKLKILTTILTLFLHTELTWDKFKEGGFSSYQSEYPYSMTIKGEF